MKTALIVVDVQKDFCPGGALPVDEGDKVVEPTNRLIRFFEEKNWPIYFTRDWHPESHCSFKANGGSWPSHCIADTSGADFHGELLVPECATIISKANTPEKDAYSGFEKTDLGWRLREEGVDAVIIAGLTTDYCVKTTALDAHRLGFNVTVAIDAVRAVNLKLGDGRCAIMHMQIRGVEFGESDEIILQLSSQ